MVKFSPPRLPQKHLGRYIWLEVLISLERLRAGITISGNGKEEEEERGEVEGVEAGGGVGGGGGGAISDLHLTSRTL